MEQVVEQLENRQVGLGPGEPLRAFAAGDDRPVRTVLELREHVFRQAALPDAGLPDDRAHDAVAGRDCRQQGGQAGALAVASDDVSHDETRRACKGAGAERGIELGLDVIRGRTR